MLARRLAVALVAVGVVGAAGCGAPSGPAPIVIGAKPDAESALVAHLYAAALRFYGSPADVQSVPDPLAELDSGVIRVVAGFTGHLLKRFDPNAVARSDAQVYRTMVSALPEGVAAGDYTTSAEDKPALAVTEKTADAWGGRDVAAAVSNCGQLEVGQIDGMGSPRRIGTCEVDVRGYPDEATLFAAVRAGQVNAAWTTTATPNIPSEFIVMSDRTSLIRAENLVPLYRRNELSESQVLAVNEVAGVLDTGSLADMRRQVAEGKDPARVADAWLDAHPLGR